MREAPAKFRSNGIAYSYARCSTPGQDKGRRRSIERQVERAKEYAADQGLTLSERNYHDTVSAFRGRNREEGWELYALIKAIEAGTIRPGSTLIIENLDRLSRDFVLDSLPVFMRILKAGIRIVTLSDRREWTTETVRKDERELLYSIMVLSRGHEESQRKSELIGLAWKRAQANAATRKIGQSYPRWLELQGNKFRVRPKQAAVIRSIFRQHLSGRGTGAIARELNGRRIPTFTGKKWGQMTVKFYLRFPAVIGEYHAGKRVKGRKVKTGQVVRDYYPAIIPLRDFHRAQARLRLNPPKRGRPQDPAANLFPGLIKCGYCGKTMGVYNARRSRSFICWNSLQGGCIRVAHPVEDVELSVFGTIEQILKDARTDKVDMKKVEEIEGRIGEAGEKIRELVRVVEAGGDLPEVVSRLKELREARDGMAAELEKEKSLAEAADSPRLLQDWLIETDRGRDPKKRLEVIPHVRRHIKRIRLFPVGDQEEEYRERLRAYAQRGVGGGQCYRKIRKELKTDRRRYMEIQLTRPVRLDGKLTDTLTLDRHPHMVKPAPEGGFVTVNAIEEANRRAKKADKWWAAQKAAGKVPHLTAENWMKFAGKKS